MIAHLLKLVWNRKRSNVLLMLEIFFAFLVVFGVVAAGLSMLARYRQSLGFDPRDVWAITLETYGPWTAQSAERFERLVREVRSLAPVVAAAPSTTSPYSNELSTTSWEQDGRRLSAGMGTASPDTLGVLGLELVAGRWFETADGTGDRRSAVIDLALAHELCGDENPLGRVLETEGQPRVVGVVRAYRHRGEFSLPGPFLFHPISAERNEDPRTLLIDVAPGTAADFEEPLTARLLATAPDWTFTIRQLETEQRQYLKEHLIPLIVGGVVAGFLLLMVVLGLTGVLWQNVTRRTREIGLRRAVGACRASVHRQIVAEVMLTASFGLILGVLVVVQIPVIGPLTFVPAAVVWASLALALTFMILLAGACGLYPGWTATRLQPAEALHYE